MTTSTVLQIAVIALSSVSTLHAQTPVFSPPPGSLIVGFRETAVHRAEPPHVRLLKDHYEPQSNELWLHVDAAGQVVEVQGLGPRTPEIEVRDAAFKIHYSPFLRNGVPAEAWVQDTIYSATVEKLPSKNVPFPPITDLANASIRLERTGCFGSCPSYSVTIRGDGKIDHYGGRFVSISGHQTATIAPSEFSNLLEQFRAANFFALDGMYQAGVTDSPTYVLKVKLGESSKEVLDYVGEWVGMPSVVTELEDAVDRVSDSARWVSSSDGTLSAMEQSGVSLSSPQAILILRTAVYAGDAATARALLSAGVTSSLPPPSPTQRLRVAEVPSLSLAELAMESRSQNTRLETLQCILEFDEVRKDHPGLQRALYSAALAGRVDLARALISAGADPKGTLAYQRYGEPLDQTYLSLAASSGVWAMIDDALSRPHDIRATDREGRTALANMVYSAPQSEDIFPLVDKFLAAGAGTSELDRLLLDTCQPNWIPGIVAREGHINARDANGNTPLFQSCSLEGVKAMLDAGADPSLRNRKGKTAIEATYPPEDGVEDERAILIRNYPRPSPPQTNTRQ